MDYMDLANQQVRKTIEKTYIGKCTVYEYRSIKDRKTKKTINKEQAVLKDKPCRLSFGSSKTVTIQDNANKPSQKVKLFISPNITVTAGSKIVVTQNGITTDYQKSGQSAMYATHQEIELELFEGWA